MQGSHIPFTRTIYSALADSLGELTCRDTIIAYYASLNRIESILECTPNLRFNNLREVPLFDSIPDATLDEIMNLPGRDGWFWAGVKEKLKELDALGDKLVECLKTEIAVVEKIGA